MPPQLLKEKTISEAEAAELFDLFFDKAHRHAPVLSRKIHTSKDTGSRSPFLFTVICTIASRYYRKRTDKLYRKCLVALRNITFEIMNKGYKSIEVVQGFLLLSTWGYPAERFEYESSYQFAGIAIRMALDLNIHVKTRTNGVFNENVEEECRNRERTWLYAFVCDRRCVNFSHRNGLLPSLRQDLADLLPPPLQRRHADGETDHDAFRQLHCPRMSILVSRGDDTAIRP